MPKTGETLMGKRFQIGFGGKGANTAMAASRLGSKCSVIAKVNGRIIYHINNALSNRIKSNCIQTKRTNNNNNKKKKNNHTNNHQRHRISQHMNMI